MKTSNAKDTMSDTRDMAVLKKLMLWINSGCNSRCRMCDIWREKVGRIITAEEIKQWVPEWRHIGVETIVLCGESLMHPEIWKIVELIKKEGVRLEILSNGILLERYAEEVVTYCDTLRVSLDGPREIHNQMRGRTFAYDRLCAGIAEVHRINPDFKASGRCAIHQQNFRFLRETVEAALEIGLTSISFSGTDMYNEEAFRRFDSINEEYVDSLIIRNDDIAELENQINLLGESCAGHFASGFISDTVEELQGLIVTYYRSLSKTACRSIRCNSPWTSAILEYDGTVRPCFPMPAYGNIKEFGSIDAVINAPNAQAFRRSLDVNTNPICGRCVDQTVNRV